MNNAQEALHAELLTLIAKLEERLKEAEKIIFSIKTESLDDRTQLRFIESLKDWRHGICSKAFEYKKKYSDKTPEDQREGGEK